MLQKNNHSKVSIIILNWNGLNDTLECIESLKKITYRNYEVILVDNGSKGNDANLLEEKYKNYIRVIKNKENLGFAEGNNVAIKSILREHDCKYILLLNNDTKVNPDFLAELVKTADKYPEVGLVGPVIFEFYKPNKILWAGGKIKWWLGAGSVRTSKITLNKKNHILSCDFLSGCCVLIKKKVFDKIGFLNKNYFVYFEDVDFCSRAKNVGFKLICNLNSKIWHKQAKSSGFKSKNYIYYFARNRIIFMQNNAKFYHLIFFTFFNTFIRYPGAFFYFLIIKKNPELARAYNRGFGDGISIFLKHRTKNILNFTIT
jgi:GT2 family glycosyltransferase